MREKILMIIEKNSRISEQEMAGILGEDAAVIKAEIEAMEKEHIICGYPTLINWDKTTVEKVSALIEVSVTPQKGQGFDSIAEQICHFPEVRSVYMISGSYDLLVAIEDRTMREVALFVAEKLSPISGILSCKTNFVLKRYKDHGSAMELPKRDERMKVRP